MLFEDESVKYEQIIPPKDVEKKHENLLTTKEYFNLPENVNKTLILNCSQSGLWSFEKAGTEFSFKNSEMNVIKSYHYVDSTTRFPGNRVYFMNNGSVIRIYFKRDKIYFGFVHDFEFHMDKITWI